MMASFKIKVIDRLGDLQLELAKLNGLLATMVAIGSSHRDGPTTEEVVNMIYVIEDIVRPAYEELTAIVEEIEEEEVEEEDGAPCPQNGELVAD
jgi:hypothetical protein